MNIDKFIKNIENIPFFFIVAKGRSGTTLLQNIFDANKHVAIPIESRIIIHLKRKYLHEKKWNSDKINEFINDLYKDIKFKDHWLIDRNELINNINLLTKDQLNFQNLCKLIYFSYPSPYPREQILLIGDKNPIYSIFIPELKEVFPDAKYIHLVRDYRASTLSIYKTFKQEGISSISYGWLDYNKRIEYQKKKSPNSFLTIRYHDLVNSPEIVIKELCNFLNIPFSDNMLNHSSIVKEHIEQNVDVLLQKELNQIHPNISKPINTKQIDKWRKELTPKQIYIIEYIVDGYGLRYGYEPELKTSFSFKSYFILLYAKIHYYFRIYIIKSYYRLPFTIRDFFRSLSNLLYDKYGYSNYFNSTDFRSKGN